MGNIYEKLLSVQNHLRVTKDQNNDFGGFKFRPAEKIFEEVKPICKENGCVLRVTDEVIEVAGRPYVKAIAELINIEKTESVFAVGHARIPEQRKGMDDCQISGAASSYARKYAMCGLFCIDDNKDSDVPPALPDKREDFERYADKVYGKREKEQAIAENQKRLDEMENWRIISPDNIEVKAKDGKGGYKWMNLDNVNLKGLEYLLTDERFEGIKNYVEERIKLIKESK